MRGTLPLYNTRDFHQLGVNARSGPFLQSKDFCSVETHMNRSGSHPNHENRQIIISTVLIRRGGAPSGAAGFIISGGMGVSTPIIYSRRSQFSWENHLPDTYYPPCASPIPKWSGHIPIDTSPFGSDSRDVFSPANQLKPEWPRGPVWGVSGDNLITRGV